MARKPYESEVNAKILTLSYMAVEANNSDIFKYVVHYLHGNCLKCIDANNRFGLLI